MKSNALIIDPYSHGSYHEVINLGYLIMISDLYEKVDYIADESSCKNLKNLLLQCKVKSDNINFIQKKISYPKCNIKGIEYLLKIILLSIFDYFYYLRAIKDSDIFYNNNIFFATPLIQWFSFGKSNKTFILCHNEMELIDKSFVYSLTTKIISFVLRFSFCYIKLSKRLNYILLSSSMVDYFNSFISKRNYNRIFAIDHCYLRPIRHYSEELVEQSYIRIGIPGAITPQRGLETLKQIIQDLKNDKLKIFSISTISDDIQNEQFVSLNKGTSLLPFEKYNSYIKAMDYMLLFYDRDSYKLTASGAVLEAIWNEKPIIALRNSYFTYLFEKFGPLGYLYDSYEQLTEGLTHLDNQIDNSIIINLKKAKQALLPCNVKKQLKDIVSCKN